jgi:agmatine deiminase
MRDVAPTFVKSDTGETVIVHWKFNAWGAKYPPWDREAAAGRLIAEQTGLLRVEPGIVAEGGALEVNGAGVVVVCTPTLVDENRNPGMSREELSAVLGAQLGVSRVIWIPAGLEGDDTDGHVDNLARFVSKDTMVVAWQPDERDPNHASTRRNIEALREATLPGGEKLQVIEFPLPPPIEHGGERLPVNYCNFVIGNAAVIMPEFGNRATDGHAREVLASFFPSRRIVGLPGSDVFVGGGCFHCATQQQPV